MPRKWLRICTAWRNHNPVISSFMITHRNFRENKNSVWHFWRRNCLLPVLEIIRSLPVLFCGVRVGQSFVVFLVFCKSSLDFLFFVCFACLRRLCQILRLLSYPFVARYDNKKWTSLCITKQPGSLSKLTWSRSAFKLY